MTKQIVAGPFSKTQAEETAKFMGAQCNVYSVYRTDEEGYMTNECDYFVERDDSVTPDFICGLSWAKIQKMQRG